jgi:hypothetical protein
MTAAAGLLAASAVFTAPAYAACNPLNPTACFPPQRAAAAQQPAQPAAQKQAAQKPLQLHPGKSKSSRHTASRSSRHHRHRVAAEKRESAPPKPESTQAAAPAEAAKPTTAPLEPKAVPTVAVATPPVAVSPEQPASGFAASQEPWSNVSAFAAPDAPAPWPSTTPRVWEPKARAAGPSADVKIVASDEVNEIDRAAETLDTFAQADGSHRGVSLVAATGADQANPQAQPGAKETEVEESWTAWLYRVCADSLSSAASAVRAVLM